MREKVNISMPEFQLTYTELPEIWHFASVAATPAKCQITWTLNL